MNAIERIKKLEARIEELERVLFEIYHMTEHSKEAKERMKAAMLTREMFGMKQTTP